MHVVVVLDGIGELAINDVHPIALPDAVTLAVKGALLLQRELAATETPDG